MVPTEGDGRKLGATHWAMQPDLGVEQKASSAHWLDLDGHKKE